MISSLDITVDFKHKSTKDLLLNGNVNNLAQTSGKRADILDKQMSTAPMIEVIVFLNKKTR